MKNIAFDGVFKPIKYFEDGNKLNFANRYPLATTIKHGAKYDKTPWSGAILKYRYAGTTPKLTTSAKESNCKPKSLCTLSFLAIKPSKTSNNRLKQNSITTRFKSLINNIMKPQARLHKVSALGTKALIEFAIFNIFLEV